MKTAIYIEDGVTQIVLTPETDHEKAVVDSFDAGMEVVEVFRGAFYDVRGGWTRYAPGEDGKSLILRLSGAQDEPNTNEHHHQGKPDDPHA